ncbi:MAG: gluconokinase [Chloroflexota bacterium]|nr:gluconokinase [Chloroflexota bacterium]
MQLTPSPLQGESAPLALAIDVGSSSLRTNLFTAEGGQVPGCEAQIAYDVRVTPDGGVEIAPEYLLGRIFEAIDGTLALAGEHAGAIRGVGMCSLVSNVMGIDALGHPTTPIYTWADTRSAGEAAQLRGLLDERAVHERTGCYIHSSYLPARLLWLRRAMPEAYERTARWITLGDWLYLRLFGEAGQSLSVASWSGLLDRHALDWDAPWLDYLGLNRDDLPPLVDADAPFTGLRREFAQRWPQLRDVPWFPCVGDGASSNLGSGGWAQDRVAVQVGTSSAMRVIVSGDVPQVPEGLWCYRATRELTLLGGALSEGGNLLDWLRRTLNVGDWQTLSQEAAVLPPDAHGLTLLPFIAGERSPGWNPAARASMGGLTLATRPVDIIRAAQEAVMYRFGLIYDQLCGVVPAPSMVIASGGALLNVPGWIGMLSDVLGVPVTASGESEASSKGVAMLVLRALGIIRDFSEVPTSLAETYRPNMANHEVYRRAMERQQAMYAALRNT